MTNSDHTVDASLWSACEEWQTEELGNILYLEYGAGLSEPQRLSGEFPVYGSNGQVGRHKTFLVEGPGIIIGRKGSIGAVFWSSDPFWPIDTTYYVRVRGDYDLRWCYWLLLSLPLNRLDSSTGVPGLNRNDAYEVLVKVPPIREEQRHIAQILDTIDTQIQETERLIAKLKQMKTGLLHDLLTRGIGENGEVRDPVAHPEQFKEILQGKLKVPNEWKIYPLQKIAEIGSGVTLGRNLIGPNTIELPYLRVANVQDGYLNLTEMKTVRVLKDEAHRFLLQPGDVLMTEGGDFDKLGRGTVWTGQISPCLHQNHIFRVRTNSHYLYPEYLALVSRSSYGKYFFLLSSKQSTNLASINSTQLKAFPIPCPPKEEQERILRVLNSHDVRITNEEACLNKLKQVKKGLMQDLLTGRVRVTQLIVDELKDASLLRASNRDK
jgi:type I restriction enzyme, S subunit